MFSPGIRLLGYLTAGSLLLAPAYGQQRGAPPSSGDSTTTGTSTGSGGGASPGSVPGSIGSRGPITTPRLPPTTTPQPMPAPERRPVFLSGRVMTDDGSPLDQSAVIISVCNGVTRQETYTDPKGRFSFQFGNKENGMLQDASMANQTSPFGTEMDQFPGPRMSNEQLLMGCDLQVQLAGYRSDSVSLAAHNTMDNPNIGTIYVHRLGKVEGSVVSATTLAASKNARKAFDKGVEALRKNKPADARKNFQKALSEFPDYAAAWNEMGRLQVREGDSEEGRKSFEAALKADPKYLDPYMNLAMLHYKARNWKELEASTAEAIRLDPYDYAQAYLLNALANLNLNRVDAAEKNAREAERLDTQHKYPQSWQLLGIILSLRRDFDGAAEQYRAYLQMAPNAADAASVRTRLAEVEKISASAAKQ